MRLAEPTSGAHGTGTGAYMLVEALVYIGLVVVILGLAFALMYRLVDNSIVLRRNSEDIAAAMRAGERWRADVRGAEQISPEQTESGLVMRMSTGTRVVQYRFDSSNVWLQAEDRPWVLLLQNVRASEMRPDQRSEVSTWRWELEMRSRAKGYTKSSKVRPLFTFTAVPTRRSAQ
jgi:hypothetical protein